MAESFRETTRTISSSLSVLRSDQPELMQAFGALSRSATREGALSAKTKELIALALGIAAHCPGCIGFHVQALVKLGATKAELEEALAVAIYMGGGPSLMYAADALRAFDEFTTPANAPA